VTARTRAKRVLFIGGVFVVFGAGLAYAAIPGAGVRCEARVRRRLAATVLTTTVNAVVAESLATFASHPRARLTPGGTGCVCGVHLPEIHHVATTSSPLPLMSFGTCGSLRSNGAHK
jgi:hypothetical protein